MAPECLTASKASKEFDVFSFGIVALEIAYGRRSIEQRDEEAQISLVAWVWDSYGKERLLDVVDKKLSMTFDQNQIECLMIVGLWCAHPDRNQRPSIRQATQVLNFESPLPILPCKMPIPNYDVPTAPAVGSGTQMGAGEGWAAVVTGDGCAAVAGGLKSILGTHAQPTWVESERGEAEH
ncbi:hypothetical protein EZV62_019324 [Acer yangbiense]|uniref:Serine-threonine/tyrosine-protein kinase catalytic domain-containing protein n=1 Tax=Acer yangbiense TaxID=1000413 RepID=A0A5C7HAX8_9ROSI|nr:hypothetical protein EZV62_019324 [Acer yangbiense]